MQDYKWICVYQYFTGIGIFQTCHFDFVRAMTERDLLDKLNEQRLKHSNIQTLVWAEMTEKYLPDYKHYRPD